VSPGDEPPYREAFFGDYGIISFRVGDTAELIQIFGIAAALPLVGGVGAPANAVVIR
jgi:hypothetical protein